MQKKKKILQKFFGPSSNLKRFQGPPFFKISKVNPIEKHVDSNFNGQDLGGTPYLKWQVCAYSKSKVGAYQVKCVLSKIWGHSVNNPSKNQAIPYQVQ